MPINEPDHYGDNQLGLQASYEIDLWGRVRNIAAAGATQAEASEADLAAIELSIEAELARDYIALEGVDAEIALLRDIAASYRGTLELTRKRVNGGIASPADESRAQAELDFVEAQIPDLQARRALLEHAIATLIGMPASGFSLPAKGRLVASPRIPLGAPSQLLERRPDIAAAERRVEPHDRRGAGGLLPALHDESFGRNAGYGREPIQLAQQRVVAGAVDDAAHIRRRRAHGGSA